MRTPDTARLAAWISRRRAEADQFRAKAALLEALVAEVEATPRASLRWAKARRLALVEADRREQIERMRLQARRVE